MNTTGTHNYASSNIVLSEHKREAGKEEREGVREREEKRDLNDDTYNASRQSSQRVYDFPHQLPFSISAMLDGRTSQYCTAALAIVVALG